MHYSVSDEKWYAKVNQSTTMILAMSVKSIATSLCLPTGIQCQQSVSLFLLSSLTQKMLLYLILKYFMFQCTRDGPPMSAADMRRKSKIRDKKQLTNRRLESARVGVNQRLGRGPRRMSLCLLGIKK